MEMRQISNEEFERRTQTEAEPHKEYYLMGGALVFEKDLRDLSLNLVDTGSNLTDFTDEDDLKFMNAVCSDTPAMNGRTYRNLEPIWEAEEKNIWSRRKYNLLSLIFAILIISIFGVSLFLYLRLT